MTKAGWQVLKDARIPIASDLILYVSASGNDATGDYTGKPFRQPQAAYDYAAANLDFRNVDLTIKMAGGSYGHFRHSQPIHGVQYLYLTGSGISQTGITSIEAHAQNFLLVSELTLQGNSNDIAGQIIGWSSAHIVLVGNVRFESPNPNTIALLATDGGRVYSNGGSMSFEGGFRTLMAGLDGGNMNLRNCLFTLGLVHAAQEGTVFCNNLGKVLFENNNWVGGVAVGKKFTVTQGGLLFTGDAGASIPGATPGVKDASGMVF